MRYRDIEYSVVQGIKRGVWKWSVSVAGTVILGRETSKAAAVVAVEELIPNTDPNRTWTLAVLLFVLEWRV